MMSTHASEKSSEALVPSPQGGVEAVDRAIAVLACFRVPGEALSLAELAQRSGLYKSTILRLCASLMHAEFVSRDDSGRFRLGTGAQRLGDLARTEPDLEHVLRPALRELQAQTGETVSFYVRDGDARVCLFRENSRQSVRHHLEEGTRHPLTIGAAGRVLAIAGSDSRTADAMHLRKHGYLLSRGGRDPDLAAVAVPLVNAHGELAGSLAISGLISRFGDRATSTFADLLLRTALDLREKLPRAKPWKCRKKPAE